MCREQQGLCEAVGAPVLLCDRVVCPVGTLPCTSLLAGSLPSFAWVRRVWLCLTSKAGLHFVAGASSMWKAESFHGRFLAVSLVHGGRMKADDQAGSQKCSVKYE